VAIRVDIPILRSTYLVGGPSGPRADMTAEHIGFGNLRRDWLPGGAQRRPAAYSEGVLRTYVRSFPETVVCKMVLLL
jgi:hypothetical protein